MRPLPTVPLNPTELDLLVEFLQRCPGRISAALVPGSVGGDALIEALREKLAPMPVEMAGTDLYPGEIGAQAIHCGETDTVFVVPFDGRRLFSSDDEAREFWHSLNFQRESLASGNVRTLFLLNEYHDLNMIHHADDLREWVRTFSFPEALPPRGESERMLLDSWKNDFAEQPVHAPVEVLHDQFNRARDAGFPSNQLAQEYAAPLFEALVAHQQIDQAKRLWTNYLGSDEIFAGFDANRRLTLLHARTLLAEIEHNFEERELWKNRMVREAEKELADLPQDDLAARARLLFRLGNLLDEQAEPEKAVSYMNQAVQAYRELAQARPDAFLPALATSLNNLGNRLSELRRREEALAHAQEAVDIRRELAKERPDAFLPDLAMSLNNLGNRLGELERREEALAHAQEAVDIRRELARTHPDVFRPDLAMSLNNLGNRLSELGRREEALAHAQEAVDLYRELVKTHPDAFRPYLFTSLFNLGNRLSELGRHEEADQCAHEVLETIAPYLEMHGDLVRDLLKRYLALRKKSHVKLDAALVEPLTEISNNANLNQS